VEPDPTGDDVVALLSVLVTLDVPLIAGAAVVPANAGVWAMSERHLASRQRVHVLGGWRTMPR
jgi:hypothetical protein